MKDALAFQWLTAQAYALDIANEWRVAQGMPESAAWARVASGLGNLPLDIGMAKPTY